MFNSKSLPAKLKPTGRCSTRRFTTLPDIGLARVYFADISERKRAEEQLRKLNRTLTALSNSNQALMHATDELTFLQQVCRIIYEDCGHAMVWIGFAENDENKSVRPVAYAGYEEGYLEAMRITWADSERGRGPTGTAIRTGRPSTSRNMLIDPTFLPWRTEAIKRGYASSLVIPLKESDKVFGAITIYSREPDTFTEGEVNLLTDLAADLTHGINTLRMRAARARAEEALRASEERLRQAADLVGLLPYTWEPLSGMLHWDMRLKALWGLPPDAVVNHEVFLAGVHPADHAYVEQRAARSLDPAGDGLYEAEYRVIGTDGVQRWISARGRTTFADGKPVSHLGVALEITERKRAEEERETTVEFLRLVNRSRGTRDLVQTATSFFQQRSACEAVGIRLQEGDDYPYYEARGFPKEFVQVENSLCSRDAAGKTIRDSDGNPAIECMCGNVILGRVDPCKSFFTANGSFWANDTTRLLATTTDADRQTHTRNRCNGEGYESVALIPLRVGQECFGLLQLNDRQKGRFSLETILQWERLADYLAVALSKFRADEALQQSEAQFRELAEGIPQLAWMANADGWLFWYNQRWYQYTGTTPQQMEGWGWQSVHDPKELPTVMERWKSSIATGEPFDMVFPLLGADGVFRPFLTRGMPLRNSQGQVVRWFGTNTDISAQKQAEQALLRSEKLASVGRMAATIAHEINNPLEAVMSLLFLARQDKELPESTRQNLDAADAELNRVAHITRQSLGFYRESSAPALTSVNAVLESAVDLLKNRIKAKHAVIEKQWDGDVEVPAVAGELRQVFTNLLANSLDAIDGGGTIKLRISTGAAFKNGDRCVRVTVADNGKGIRASLRQHLFQPFFTTKGTVGTGLGLWVSKEIIEKHGGTIRMRSSTDGARRGTVFSVVLPAEPVVAVRSQSAGA